MSSETLHLYYPWQASILEIAALAFSLVLGLGQLYFRLMGAGGYLPLTLVLLAIAGYYGWLIWRRMTSDVQVDGGRLRGRITWQSLDVPFAAVREVRLRFYGGKRAFERGRAFGLLRLTLEEGRKLVFENSAHDFYSFCRLLAKSDISRDETTDRAFSYAKGLSPE